MSIENRVCFQVNMRDGLCCRVCGKAPLSQENYHRGFQYHHVQAQSENGSDETDNIVLLCANCHLRHHQGKLKLPHLDNRWNGRFLCRVCEAELDAQTVEMNCGWYLCDKCGNKTHLWTHCGLDEKWSRTRTDADAN